MVVLLTGPAGVGKDTLIREIVRLDTSLKWVPKYTNRLLREDEKGRVHADDSELVKMEEEGKVRIIVNKFGIKIAEPISDIRDALVKGLVPIIDYSIGDVSDFRARIGAQVFNVYVSPPNKEDLKLRLEKAGRVERLEAGISELREVENGNFSKNIDFHVVNHDVESTARSILAGIKTAK
jgi:guanylate kinase